MVLERSLYGSPDKIGVRVTEPEKKVRIKTFFFQNSLRPSELSGVFLSSKNSPSLEAIGNLAVVGSWEEILINYNN